MIQLFMSRSGSSVIVPLNLPASHGAMTEAYSQLEQANRTGKTEIVEIKSVIANLPSYLGGLDPDSRTQLAQLNLLSSIIAKMDSRERSIYAGALDGNSINDLNDMIRVAEQVSDYILIPRRKERMPILQPLESMERISRQALADDLDTVLERISREDIGLVITEEGKDDLVLCPASWFNLDYVDDFSCVINSALRYAMRSEDEESAAVVQYLRRHYQLFDEKTLSVAVADLERELNQPIVTLKQPQVWKELQELFRQRLDELRKESSEGEETHHG